MPSIFAPLQIKMGLSSSTIENTKAVAVSRLKGKETSNKNIIRRVNSLEKKVSVLQTAFRSVTRTVQRLQNTIIELDRRRRESEYIKNAERRSHGGIERIKNVEGKSTSLGLNLGLLAGLATVAMVNALRNWVKEFFGKQQQQFKEWAAGQILSLSKQFEIFKRGTAKSFERLGKRISSFIEDRVTGHIKKPTGLTTLDKNGRELHGGALESRIRKNERIMENFRNDLAEARNSNKALKTGRVISSASKKVFKFSKAFLSFIAKITGLKSALEMIRGLSKLAGAIGKAVLVLLVLCDTIITAYHNYIKFNPNKAGREIQIRDVIDEKVIKEFVAAVAGLVASVVVGGAAASVGASLGLVMGSVIPGVGNVIGAILGLLGGLVVSWVAAGAADFIAREAMEYFFEGKTSEQVWNDIKAAVIKFVKDNTVEKVEARTKHAFASVMSFFSGQHESDSATPKVKPSISPNLSIHKASVSSGNFITDAVNLIEKEEGFSKKAYEDSSSTEHHVSIGYGHQIKKAEYEQGYIQAGTEKIKLIGHAGIDTTITKEQALALLRQDIPNYLEPLEKSLGAAWAKLSDLQKATLLSSAYNTGQGGINRLIKHGLKDAILAGNFNRASQIIQEYRTVTSKGGVNPTLVARRKEEALAFASTVDSVSPVKVAVNAKVPSTAPSTASISTTKAATQPPVVVAVNQPQKKASIQRGIPNPGYSPRLTEDQSVRHVMS